MIKRLVVLIGILVSSMLAQEPTTSEPADLQVQFRFASGSNAFRVGEVIPVEVLLSSTTPNRYLAPCALFRESNFGYPQCRYFSRWSFTITPEDGWVDYTKEFDGPKRGGGPMFEVPTPPLTSQAVSFPYILTNRFRFDKPGEYEIHLSIDVGLNDASTQLAPRPEPSVQPHSVSVMRDLGLEIVPAEAEWQKEIVRRGAEAYSAPPPRETNPLSKELLEYRQAKQDLCALGTPEAARVLAKALLVQDIEAQNCLERSPSLPAGIEEMQHLLTDPDVAVSPTFFSALVGFLNINESKQVGGVFLAQPDVDRERDTLFAALPQKRADAQTSSLATVLQYSPRTKATPWEDAHDSSFPPAVVAVAAQNFERLPPETQQLLLEEGWDRIRSPLMLPVVRHKAEAGDGPSLLRWLELEPAPATAFIRNEIVRPQPRFSSYYLRLPDVSLPNQERLIATNFASFASLNDDHDLVHAATLLHRYATGAVLPIVLPFIDAELTDWPCSIQAPVLAYLLKVSPEKAAPRVERVLESTNRIQICTGRLLTTLGVLQPGSVLERLSMDQIETDSPAAGDGAHYVQRYAPPQLKPRIWQQLEKWHQRFVFSGGAKRVKTGIGSLEDIEMSQFVSALTEAFEKAQGWTLSPEDATRLQALLDPDTMNQLKCNFHCDGLLSISPGPAEYTIYNRVIEGWQRRENEQESMEYLNSPERLSYGINQYRCDNLKTLQEKLLQFPRGSTFGFTGFSGSDRDELEEISNFLGAHGYELRNAQGLTLPRN